MKKKRISLVFLGIAVLLSGCVVRTYPLTRNRVDQRLSEGNRGYLQGQAPSEVGERKTGRTVQIVEVELRSPIKFETMPKKRIPQTTASVLKTEDKYAEGNRGYITQSIVPEIAQPEAAGFQKYTVQKNDTLQKISQKFYGTSKKWNKIFQANKDTLKGPNKIYPGQVINIPVEGLKAPRENLK